MPEKAIEHPLEEIFDLEAGTTLTEYDEPRPPAELIDHAEYDNKDKEVEQQLEEVYSVAMNAFDIHSEMTEQVEGKYKARNAEVAATYLQIALNSVVQKSKHKQHKDNVSVSKASASTPKTQNNLIVNRTDLLHMISGNQEDMKDVNNIEDVEKS